MKPLIKNINSLYGIISEDGILHLETAARLHRQYSNLSFTVIQVSDNKIIVHVIQGRSSAENYFDQKRLIQIVHEMFDSVVPPGTKLNIHAVPYKEPEVNIVDSKWINNRMHSLGIKVKDIAEETGIDRSQISALLSKEDPRPLSQTMKAFFYYYFKSKESSIKRP